MVVRSVVANDDGGNDSWAEFHAEIDKRLDQIRPQRSGKADKAWREEVYGWARNHIPDETNVIRTFAEREVDNQERLATRRGNRLLRSWAHGRRPLIWHGIGPLPVIVGRERVRLDAVTPEDIETAATQMDEESQLVRQEILLLVEAMRELAKEARRRRFAIVSMVGDLAPLQRGHRLVRLHRDVA
jgi:hypothetical protein